MNTNDRNEEIKNSVFKMNGTCPTCNGHEFELRNYSVLWHDGDIHCAACGQYIQMFDAG